MTQLQSNQLPKLQPDPSWSIPLFRWVGYGLLILAGIDLLTVIFPFKLMNPVWEFQTAGAIVDRTPVLLLGVMLVFYGEMHLRRKWEPTFLKILSWFCLLLGILLPLLIPLSVGNTIRIHHQNIAQISTGYNQRMEQFAQFEQRLYQSTPEEINQFLQDQGLTLGSSASQLTKEQLTAELTKVKRQVKSQFDSERYDRRAALLKNSIRWNLGALVAGILFIYLWRLTWWARPFSKQSERKR